MYCLFPPIINGLKVFDNIISSRSIGSKTLLNGIRSNVAKTYNDYFEHSGNGMLLSPLNLADELKKKLRENFRYLGKDRSYSFLRDEILASARFGCCPYCNVGPVGSLDHVLPRNVYPEFTVLAQNLVPACDACNRKKGQTCFYTDKKNLMHPYYVHIPTDAILFARLVVNGQDVHFEFYLQKSSSIDDEHFNSIASLFSHLQLAKLYGQVSMGEISDRWESMDDCYNRGGPSELGDYLQREAASSRSSRGENYWKTALLWALAKSTYFCSGGYKRFG